MNNWFDRLLTAFFPDRCACCGRVVRAGEEFCSECRAHLVRQPLPLCSRCGLSKQACLCSSSTFKWDGATAPFIYVSPIKQGIRLLKHSHNRKSAATLAHQISAQVALSFPNVPFDAVMPVPMHPRDRKKRGYSQSEWLAQTVAADRGLVYENRLRKLYRTHPQKNLTGAQRRANLRGAFDVDEHYDAPGKIVLLVDDLMTTGSTLDECATVLKIYGVRQVYVATVAVAWPKEKVKELITDAGNKIGN